MEQQLTIRSSLLLIVLAVLGIYFPVIHSPLNPIDDIGIYQYLLNSDVSGLLEIFIPVGVTNYYRPVLWVTFWIDKYLWGLEESFMHLMNMGYHLVNSVLVFGIARKACILSGVRSNMAPLIAALLFATHPINAEAVNWIAGRTDLLAGLFLFSSVLLLLRHQVSWLTSFLAALCFLIACLAKETAVFFLPALMILPFFIIEAEQKHDLGYRIWVSSLLHAVFLAFVGVAYFFFRALAFSRGDVGVSHALAFLSGEQGLGLAMKLRLILKAAGFYSKKLFIPFPLNFGIVHVSDFYILIGLVICLSTVFLLKKRTLLGFFFLGAFSVGASALIIPLLEATWTPLAERYMYISSAFFVVGMTLWVCPLLESGRRKYLGPFVVLSTLIVATYGSAQRTLLWQDNLALFQDTIEKSPSFMPAKSEVANALFKLGRDREAIEVVKTIDIPQGHSAFQLGVVIQASAMAKDGNILGACAVLENILLDPGGYEGRILERLLNLYDYRMMALEEDNQAFHSARASVLSRLYEMNGDPFYLYRLGQAYLSQGNNASAKDAFSRCAKQAPSKAHYYQAALKLSEKM